MTKNPRSCLCPQRGLTQVKVSRTFLAKQITPALEFGMGSHVWPTTLTQL